MGVMNRRWPGHIARRTAPVNIAMTTARCYRVISVFHNLRHLDLVIATVHIDHDSAMLRMRLGHVWLLRVVVHGRIDSSLRSHFLR